jgi:hypothetical protein
MGHAVEGAMSGLHHDYHDNLYCLLRGKKVFDLFPPSDAALMHTVGAIERVHHNGRIVYEGSPAAPDGADPDASKAVDAAAAVEAAEAELEAAEAAVEAGEEGAEDRLARAEAALEAAMDGALDMEMDGMEMDGMEEEEEEREEEGEEEREEEGGRSVPTDEGDAVSKPPPVNFSHIDLRLPADKVVEAWPDFGKVTRMIAEVKAGEMLYLPAGWFHNVTSFSGDSAEGHAAFNFWFHPPDADTDVSVDAAATDTFLQPYSRDVWPRQFAEWFAGDLLRSMEDEPEGSE